MDIFEYIDRVKANFDKQPEPRYNTKKYFTDNVDDIGPGPNNRNKIPRLNVMPETYNSEEQGSGVMIDPRGLQDGKIPLPTQGLDDGGRVGFSTAGLVTNLLSKIPVRTGAERVKKITDLTPQKKFMKSFTDFMNKKHNGNFSSAAEAIGQDRNKIRAIFDRVREAETGTRKGGIGIGTGVKKIITVPTPKNLIPYTDATTKVKTDKNFLKDKINDSNKNKFYSPTDIANILGVDVSNKAVLDNLTADLKRFGVANKATTGQMKNFKLGDAVNKITKGYEKKLVKGQKDSQTKRLEIDKRLDSDLKNFLSNFRQATRNISKEEGIFVPGAIEDVGHPLSVKITDKYPKLTKNSNINKINTLTFQDPQINREILEKTGYEAKHNSLLKSLNKLVGKKIGPKELEELKLVKSQMNTLHNKALIDIKNVAKEIPYLKGQENRLPKIDINIPKQGQTFKSEDLFVDMSNVNPAFRVGLVEDINPNAKFFKDLNTEQKEIYKRNVLDQTKFNLNKFYTKTGYSKEQVEELKDSLEFGTSSKLGIGTVGTLGLGSTAAVSSEPGAETLDSFPTKTAAGATLAAGAVGTKTGRNILGKTFKGLGVGLGPTGVIGLNYALGVDPKNTADRIGLEAETALAPALVKGVTSVTDKIKTPMLRKIAERASLAGLSPAMALRIARVASPIGLATLAGEGLYQAGKYGIKRRKELQEMSPEQLQELKSKSDDFAFNEFSAASGGLANLTRTIPPEKGPQSQGLAYFMKNGKR